MFLALRGEMSQTELKDDNYLTIGNKVNIHNEQKNQVNSHNRQTKTKIHKINEKFSTRDDQGLQEAGNSKMTNCCASFLLNLYQTDLMKIQLFHDRWKLTATCRGKTEKYNHVMEQFSSKAAEDRDNVVCLDTVWLPFIKYSNTVEADRDRQYAFSIVLMKNGTKEIFQDVYPEFQNKKKESGAVNIEAGESGLTSKTTLHSEEILIQQLDDFLQHNGKMVEHILIYTYNSPCLKREKKIVPCMFQLLYKVYEWHKHYEVITDVAFTKHWGLSGPNYFKNLTYSIISCPSSIFYSCTEKCKDIPFKLDHKKLKGNVKISRIYNTLSCSKDKAKLHKDIQSARKSLMSLAEKSSGLCQDHLDRGYQMINSFIFPSEVHEEVCQILKKEWNEMVDDSSMTLIRKHITEQFNSAVVHLFREQLKSFLGNSSLLRLHHVLRMQLWDGLIKL